MNQIVDFRAGQSLKLRRNTCFRGLKFYLVMNFDVPKAGRLAPSKV